MTNLIFKRTMESMDAAHSYIKETGATYYQPALDTNQELAYQVQIAQRRIMPESQRINGETLEFACNEVLQSVQELL